MLHEYFSNRRHPVLNLTSILRKHGAFRKNNLSILSLLYGKLILQEPLRILETVKYKDTIEQHTLEEDPIFIIGHWRSGTSFLQYLLSRDPQFGYLSKLQAVFPDIFLNSESLLKGIIDRIPDSFKLVKDAQDMSINLDLDSPSELDIALTAMISPASPHWGHLFPKGGEEYFNKYIFFDGASQREITRWKHDYQYLVNKVSINNAGRQILVKSPGNTARIDIILELYPNARFIFIYRNPYDVFYSNHKLWDTVVDNLGFQRLSRTQKNEFIIDLYTRLMKGYLELRPSIPAGQLTEIRFETFVADPISSVRNLYDQINLPGYHAAETQFNTFLDKQNSRSSGSYNYESDIVERLNEEWGFAFQEWNYPVLQAEYTG